MKQAYVFGCIILAASGGSALAESSSQVAWTLETLQRVENGDPGKGREIAQKSCESCHAATPKNAGAQDSRRRESSSANATNVSKEVSAYQDDTRPNLRGQLATYLYKELHDYKDGSRPHIVMAAFAAGLSDQDMADVAAFYSREAGPSWQKADAVPENIEQLVEHGDSRRILPPCAICHEPDGRGQKIDTPALAGQKAAYLVQTLQAYKSGERRNDLYGRMRSITQQLSDEEIAQLARYYMGSVR
jgi:cytochrome c553